MKKINLENFTLAIVFLLPTYLIRFKILGLPTNLLEILIILVGLFWLLWDRRRITLPLVVKWCILFLLVFLGLSAFLNDHYLSELGIIKGWFLLPLFFSFLALSIFKGKEEKIFQAYFLSVLGVAMVALGHCFLGTLTYDGRLEGFFNSPNYLAMYMAPGFLVGIVSPKPAVRLKRVFYYSSLGLILIGIYLTHSYAAFLGILMSLAVVSGFIYKSTPYRRVFILTVALLITGLFFFQSESNKFSGLTIFNGRSSSASRIMIWKSTERIMADHWFWGIGPGNFQEKYLEYQRYFPPYLEWAVPHPHNLYLAFWLSVGLLGLLSFLALVIFWFTRFLKSPSKEKHLISLVILVYILAHGFFDTTYFKNDLAVVFWLALLWIPVKD